MERIEEYLNLVKTKEKMTEDEILDAANKLIAIVSEKKELTDTVVNSIHDIYNNELELIKIRAVEIALKLLEYSLYNVNRDYADKIIEFLRKHIGSASENVQSAVIIHYSWAHRKFPHSKDIIRLYDDLISEFNKDKDFHKLFEEINYMEGTT